MAHIDSSTLNAWYSSISSGMLKKSTRDVTAAETIPRTIRQDYSTDVRIGGETAGSKITDSFLSPTAAYEYDFDKRATELNAALHPSQPNTVTYNGRSDSNRTLNTTGVTGMREVPVPLNAAIRNLDDMVSNFDISRLPDYNNMAMHFCGHLLFSRPSLYLKATETNLRNRFYQPQDNSWYVDPERNYNAFATEPLVASFVNDRTGRMLLNQLTQFSSNPYIPLFTTKALTYTTSDIQLKTIEKGQTFYGHNIKYGHYNEDHKAGGTMTIEFLNDRYWSVLRTCYMWLAYIYMVSKTNVVRPSLVSQTNGILDYAGSIYYLVTDTDNRRLVYWEKLTGVFPRMVPFSLFSTEDNPKVEDKVSIEFDYGIKSDPCDPNILADINMLSYGFLNSDANMSGTVLNDVGEPLPSMIRQDSFRGGIMARGNVEAARPVIREVDTTSGRNYYLEWLVSTPSGGNASEEEYS